MDKYPHGCDYAWLAVDAVGHVAIFITAGVGPIPSAVLLDRERADQAEDLVNELPERCNHNLFVSLPRPDDFIAFARRGLFAYDWDDVHRIRKTDVYHLLASPWVPAKVDELSPDVASLARLVEFNSIQFADSLTLTVSG